MSGQSGGIPTPPLAATMAATSEQVTVPDSRSTVVAEQTVTPVTTVDPVAKATPTRSATLAETVMSSTRGVAAGSKLTPPPTKRKTGTKRPKIDSPISDGDASDSMQYSDAMVKQTKLFKMIKQMFDEIVKLNTTLGGKTKVETRQASENLIMLKETVEKSDLLSSLEQLITAQQEIITENEDMDTDVIEEKEENLCSKCKKQIAEEADITQEIRRKVQDAHIEKGETLNENVKNTLQKKWPEGCFQKSEIVVGNPLQITDEGDMLLVMKDVHDDAYIVRKLVEKHPELKSIIEEDLLNSNLEYLENNTRTKNGLKTSKRLYVTPGGTMEEIYQSIKELEKETRSGNKLINVIAADEKIRTLTRKIIEIVFLQSNTSIKIYTPKREGKEKPTESKYETIVVSSTNKSYSDMLKAFRQNIDPEKMGMEIRTTKKTKDDSLLIVAEKGNRELLQREITDNVNLSEIHIVEKTCEMIIAGMDAVTTKEEIEEALSQKLGADASKIEIKSIHTNRVSEKVATLGMSVDIAHKLAGSIKIGWSMCRIKEKVSVPRCTNCLKLGHTMRNCKSKLKLEKQCMRCTKQGHESKECTNQSFCPTCNKEGHRADSMSCPTYRRMVYQKGSSITN
ncbi:uncharacterized protein LOC113469939 [Diaphorina citri]|uniref:Uncharacterized protein LOC113469939 n=1 Tax=Diaphorina citri TaxID=121845 RepID=A0A3Q0J5N8_DIACI|nr:uncharacterized protein LOC113469939 [Diaphorina citri]